MRVLLVCPYAWDRAGGVRSHVRALGAALQRRGHDVRVVAPVTGPAPPAEPVLRRAGRAVGVPFNGSVAPIAPGPAAFVTARRAVARFRPDVVHVHEPLVPGPSLYSLVPPPGPPVVGTFHAAAERNLFYAALRPALARVVEGLRVRTGVSPEAIALAGRYFPGRFELTPNGVEVERFRDARPVELGPGTKVLFLGRLEPRKGLDVLIRAMQRLHDLDATLVVVGTGPREEECRALARRLGVRTQWLGSVSDDDLPRLYRSAEVYCHPATGGESFGIVLLEAMAAAVPVVCSDLPGFTAAAGDAARFFPAGDHVALAGSLRAVLTSEGEARVLRALGEARAAAFDWAGLVADVEALYARATA